MLCFCAVFSYRSLGGGTKDADIGPLLQPVLPFEYSRPAAELIEDGHGEDSGDGVKQPES